MFPQLQVLLWMHFISRKRRFILTLVELVSPTLLIILLFILKDEMIADGSHPRDPDIVTNEPYSTKSFNADKLIYYPKTVATQKLMSTLDNDIKIKNQDIIGKSNESETSELIQKITRKSALIAFETSKGLVDTIPNNLEYTLRMKLPAVSSISEDDVYTRHSEYASTYEPFMAIQWTLNKRYMRELSLYQIPDYELYLAEMPFVKAKAPKYKQLGSMLEPCCKTSLMIPFLCLMTTLVTFRLTGIQELLKINGVDPKYLSLSYILNALPTGLVYALVTSILLTVSATPYVPNSNPFLIFLIMLLHFLTIAGFAYVCSFFPSNMEYLTTLAILMYFLMWLPSALLDYYVAVRKSVLFIYTFLPHGPLSWFIVELEALESGDEGISFSTMFVSHTSRSYSVFMAYLASLLQLAIISQLVKYLNQVRPGPYGTAKHYNFFCKGTTEPTSGAEMEQLVRDERYFQPPPTDKVLGIHIEHITKIFKGGKAALNDVSFDVYQGEITVLLGHNGAGKTTLMSIVTGLLSPNSGTVRVEGLDVAESKEEIRKKLGLCPQHNQFIPDLNVLEHVMFFAMLKGMPRHTAKESCMKLLAELNISKQAGHRAEQLSGGMRRRLQLGCALAGGAATVVLDEPTAGLDIETRRDLWDLLLGLRGKRTILITTHFMEEAEALADRVLVLAHGAVCAHATPCHLKKYCGSGYQLQIRTNSDKSHPDIKRAIHDVSGDSTIKQHTPQSITFILPIGDVGKYTSIFTVLEEKKNEFGILSMGLSMPTLEEVFLKLSSTVNSETDENDDTEQHEYLKRTGFELLTNQVIALIRRLVLHIMNTLNSFLVTQVILPILLIFLVTHIINTNAIEPIEAEDLEINLNLFKDHHKPIVFLDLQEYRKENWDLFEKKYNFVTFINSTNITADVIEYGKASFGKYRQILFGIWRNQDESPPQLVIYFSTLVRYAGPVAIDLLSNVLINDIKTNKDVKGPDVIKTHCKSLTEGLQIPKDADKMKFPKSIFSTVFWSIFVAKMFVSGVAGSVQLAGSERVRGSRGALRGAGAGPRALWGARLGFHCALYCAALLLPVLLAQALLDSDQVYNKAATAGALFFTLFLGMLAYLAFCYWMSFYFSSRASLVLGVFELAGLFLGFIQTLYTISQSGGQGSITKYVTQITEVILTPQTFVIALIKVGMVANKNALCTLNMETCPNALNVLGAERKKLCCVDKTLPYSYFDPEVSDAYYNFILLAAQFVVYMAIIYLLETGTCSYIAEKIKVAITKHNGRSQRVGVLVDDITMEERNYVKKCIEKKSNEITDAMLVNDLHKVYMKFFSSVQVVNGVSFSVKKGEIFGILGVNGAGKSTTFRMIAAETFPTVGKLYSSGYHLTLRTRPKYMKSIGYCSQFAELDGFMTGEQYIKTLLILSGFYDHDITKIMNIWFDAFQLQQHKRKLISQLSGGCKRRMAALAALCVQASVCVLDEPTAGVDVMARRGVCAALRRAAHSHTSLIITSHSLDEMETLCDRIAILCDGEIKAIGTPADLKSAYGAGYNVIFNLTQSPDNEQRINLKIRMNKDYNCILKDEHMTMLRYRIADEMPYSVLFKNLEELKDLYPIIEDYVVLQNTLEEAFLSFSKRNESV